MSKTLNSRAVSLDTIAIPKNPSSEIPLEQFIEFARAGVDISSLIRVDIGKKEIDKSNANSTKHNPTNAHSFDLNTAVEIPQEQLDELSLQKYSDRNKDIHARRF